MVERSYHVKECREFQSVGRKREMIKTFTISVPYAFRPGTFIDPGVKRTLHHKCQTIGTVPALHGEPKSRLYTKLASGKKDHFGGKMSLTLNLVYTLKIAYL